MTEPLVKVYKVPQDVLFGFRECFEALDTEGKKKLNRAQLETFLRDAELAPELCDLAFTVCDKDKSGFLDFDEFAEVIIFQQLCEEDFPVYFRRIFDAFDEDKNGKLDSKELLRYLKVARVTHADKWTEYIMAQTGGQPVTVEVLIKVLLEARDKL
jgi:Ca2+-binding EF-hand superfamily protein